MVAEGRIAAYGVSVERVEEALKAIEYPNVATCRSSSTRSGSGRRACSSPRPRAAASGSSCACRWPRACCRAATTRETRSRADDHRNYNRQGEAFDVGETFAGVPFEVGLDAVEEMRRWCPTVQRSRS